MGVSDFYDKMFILGWSNLVMVFALASFETIVFAPPTNILLAIFCLKYKLLNSNFFIKLLYKSNISTAVIYLCFTQ